MYPTCHRSEQKARVLEFEGTEEKSVVKDSMQNETLKAAGQTQLLSSGLPDLGTDGLSFLACASRSPGSCDQVFSLNPG